MSRVGLGEVVCDFVAIDGVRWLWRQSNEAEGALFMPLAAVVRLVKEDKRRSDSEW